MYPYVSPGQAPSGLPPVGLASPFSRRLDPHPEEDPAEFEVVPSDDSQNTLTTPPARRRELSRERGMRTRGTPAPSARNLDELRTPRSSARVSLAAPPDDDISAPPLRASTSRHSLASNKSYSKFNPEEYVDPAILTSGRSRLLPLPQEEPIPTPAPGGAGAGGKGKKSKKKRK